MLKVVVEKTVWDAVWLKARNTLSVHKSQAKSQFGTGANSVIERMTRAAEEVLDQTRQTLEDE